MGRTRTTQGCQFPGCQHPRIAGRGLCPNHYSAALRLIKTGATTWEKLEKEGRTRPSTAHNVSDWFLFGGRKGKG